MSQHSIITHSLKIKTTFAVKCVCVQKKFNTTADLPGTGFPSESFFQALITPLLEKISKQF